jgi:AcrR family transcriptional regulator
VAGRPRLRSDEDILAATARAISAVGPSVLTLADVAREAGVAPATLVQRFGSKRGLLLAFTKRASAGVEAGFAAARRETHSPLRALVSHLVAMASGLRTPEELSHHLAFLQLELGDEEFRSATLQHTDAMVREIAGLLQAAVTAGELEACDTRRLARAVHVTYSGALITWAIMRTGDIDRFLHDELEFLLERYRPSPIPMRAAPKVTGAGVSPATQPGSTNTSPAPS